ncbi:MAG: hypothetical protein K1X94_26155 [Sandaracinaceae bacterium]|nr:hypothetical protein [Sandaracinaceae bacterium]
MKTFALAHAFGVALVLTGLATTSTASAQFVPTQCDFSDANVTYGSITVGATVQLAMHTPWRGDANWNADMNRFVGMTAIITSLDGVDGVGCPVVRVNVDSGQFYWRIRDMRVLSVAMPVAPTDPIPRYCGMTTASVQFGMVRPGATVVLGAHTFAGPGDDLNWSAEMNRWVGSQAVVTSLEQVDGFGCPVVRVSADGGQYYWRIRDMQLVGGMAPPPPPAMTIPTWCGQSSDAPQYGPLRPGSWVVLGMHTADVGDANWAGEMSRWVGQQTTVTGYAGTDAQGCPTVRVAADGGQYAWRIRNMTFLR